MTRRMGGDGRCGAVWSPLGGGGGGGGSGGSGQFPSPGSKLPNAMRPREEEPEPQPVLVPRAAPSGVPVASGVPVGGPTEAPPRIKAFEQRMTGKHEDKGWSRTPNSPGTGAIHVRSFHCKLNSESLEFLDQQINEWLDAHPQYEVKFVTTGVGEWTGKTREPNLVVQVWV